MQPQNTNSTPAGIAVRPSVFHAEAALTPHPERKPKTLETPFGLSRTDEYYWLNERENPAVTAYLEAENRYADSVLAPVKSLRESLFNELKARIQEDDNSVPYLKDDRRILAMRRSGAAKF